jgi:serine-type D-Ala-D-Ala endopeptidase (penicillin-binding protein 7)
MWKSLLFSVVMSSSAASWAALPALPFGSAHALVVDEATGEVLLEKDSSTPAPMASLTKLLTAMVVLDAQLDPQAFIRIDEADRDTIKHTTSGVPVGEAFAREGLIQLALVASDNRAAAALARTYPGGTAAFLGAVQLKALALGLRHTTVVEPTGLSPENRSSAADLAKVLQAAGGYPAISRFASQARDIVPGAGKPYAVKNTNALIGQDGWHILLSKTGFINEAGRCLTMRMQAAGRTVLVVLMGALTTEERTTDAHNVRRWLSGDVSPRARPTKGSATAQRGTAPRKATPPRKRSRPQTGTSHARAS